MFKHLLILSALLLTLVKGQFGLYGCYMTLNNIEKDCPLNRLFEMSMLIGTFEGAGSDDLDLQLEFIDYNQNSLMTLKLLKWPNCNSYEKGNTDVVRMCSSIVELTSTVKISVTKSDEVQIQALTMSLGDRIVTKTKFWFDDVKKGDAIYNYWPVYGQM